MPDLYIQNLIEKLAKREFDFDFYVELITFLKKSLNENSLKGYLHPLGFIIITLKDWSDNQRLRLHIWTENDRKYNNNQEWVHNHECSVNSLVLMGKIIHKRYEILNDNTKRNLPIFKVSYESKNSDLILTDETCDIILKQEDELNFGDSYNIQKWNFHMVEAKREQVTSTLVLNYERESGTGFVIGSNETIKTDLPYSRIEFDNHKLRMLIIDLIAHLTEKKLQRTT